MAHVSALIETDIEAYLDPRRLKVVLKVLRSGGWVPAFAGMSGV